MPPLPRQSVLCLRQVQGDLLLGSVLHGGLSGWHSQVRARQCSCSSFCRSCCSCISCARCSCCCGCFFYASCCCSCPFCARSSYAPLAALLSIHPTIQLCMSTSRTGRTRSSCSISIRSGPGSTSAADRPGLSSRRCFRKAAGITIRNSTHQSRQRENKLNAGMCVTN